VKSMKEMSRRKFLEASVGTFGAAATGALVSPKASLARAGPSIQFPSSARERLAVASWPFRACIDSASNPDRDPAVPGMDLPTFSSWVKREFNVPGVEPLGQHFPDQSERFLDFFRESNEKNGVRVVNIPIDNEDSYYDADREVRKKVLESGKKWVHAAARLGSPSIRTSIAPAKNAKPVVSVLAEQLEQLADYGGSKNIVVNLENDNLVSEDAFFLVKVLDKLNHPYLHALPDFCNSMQTGDEKFNTAALTELFPRAYNICHVKDSESAADGKTVHVDLKKVFGILKASQYRGFLSMEWEGAGSPHEGTRSLIQGSLENL
jgi:sugar phosphate isomerase/epimerase